LAYEARSLHRALPARPSNRQAPVGFSAAPHPPSGRLDRYGRRGTAERQSSLKRPCHLPGVRSGAPLRTPTPHTADPLRRIRPALSAAPWGRQRQRLATGRWHRRRLSALVACVLATRGRTIWTTARWPSAAPRPHLSASSRRSLPCPDHHLVMVLPDGDSGRGERRRSYHLTEHGAAPPKMSAGSSAQAHPQHFACARVSSRRSSQTAPASTAPTSAASNTARLTLSRQVLAGTRGGDRLERFRQLPRLRARQPFFPTAHVRKHHELPFNSDRERLRLR